ncbi:unnamed protein product [Peronospora belbahrii]|uniref:Guanine nucleotide-binding protein subunit beta-like protein n=1 Tax=Peronospora belbahrii TaxID=622444 RepID=A0ABN8CPF1_9STRA|nr:unnamed protein product [Peronospora belbahrii]
MTDTTRLQQKCENLKATIELKRKEKADGGFQKMTNGHINLFKPFILSPKCRRVLKGHFGKIYAMQWSSDNTSLLSASQDGKLIVWNGYTSNKIQSIPLRV